MFLELVSWIFFGTCFVAFQTDTFKNGKLGNLIKTFFSNAEALPPQKMLNATQELIAYAIEQGHVTKDYKLLGHKQVRDTICPGPALYQEIQTWPNFDNDVQFNFNSIL